MSKYDIIGYDIVYFKLCPKMFILQVLAELLQLHTSLGISLQGLKPLTLDIKRL